MKKPEKSKTYVTLLSSDSYLPGLLVLDASLKSVDSRFPLHVIVTGDVTRQAIECIESKSIRYTILEKGIHNPTDVSRGHRWFPTYSKLAVFGMTQYAKIVYVDADMLVLRNIDELFECENLSATNAGGMLPRKAHWIHMNTGLFVIEPSRTVFDDMMEKVGKIEDLVSGGTSETPKRGSDQDFLNAYFPDWLQRPELHLDHKYNIFHYYLDEYNKLFGYTIDGERPVSVIHFASHLKPWDIGRTDLVELKRDSERKLEFEAIVRWQEIYNRIIK